MNSATVNIPSEGGQVLFTYNFTGSCMGQTVDNWTASGTTSDLDWFTYNIDQTNHYLNRLLRKASKDLLKHYFIKNTC